MTQTATTRRPPPHRRTRRTRVARTARCEPCGCGGADGCGDLPELARLRYFHGQPLGALDLRREQAYHRDRARLHNRLLHGWGVVCGLEVDGRAAPSRSRTSATTDPTIAEVIVLPGRRAGLPRATRSSSATRGRSTSTRLLDEDEPQAPRREARAPSTSRCASTRRRSTRRGRCWPAGCEPTPDCEHAPDPRVLPHLRHARAARPGPALRAVLRRLRRRLPGARRDPRLRPRPSRCAQEQVDLAGRRSLALRELTEIVGINWVHGAHLQPRRRQRAARRRAASSGSRVGSRSPRCGRAWSS